MIRFDLVGPAADSQCCQGKVGPSKRQLWMSLYLTWWWRLGIFSPNCTRSVQVPRSLRYCRRWCWARSFHSTVPTVPDMKILYRWSSTSAPLYGFRGLTLQVLCFPSSFWAFGCFLFHWLRVCHWSHSFRTRISYFHIIRMISIVLGALKWRTRLSEGEENAIFSGARCYDFL